MDYLALVLTKLYNITVKIPKWILFLISGGIASTAIGFMHRPSKEEQAKAKAKALAQARAQKALEAADTTSPAASDATSSQSKRTNASKRKNGKK